MGLAMKYTIDFERGDFTGDQLRAEGAGGADALLFMSMIFPEDGSASHAVFGFDGRTGEDVAPEDLGRAWAHLTFVVARTEGVPRWLRAIAEQAHKLIKVTLTADRQDQNAPKN